MSQYREIFKEYMSKKKETWKKSYDYRIKTLGFDESKIVEPFRVIRMDK